MRVALVNHRDWPEGGMEKVALSQLDALAHRGHTVALFAQHHAKNRQTPYQKYFPKNVDRQNYALTWRNLHRLPREVLNTFDNPEAGGMFGAFLDDFKPDIVHVHGLLRAFSPSFYHEASRRGIPLLQTHHYVKLVCPTSTLLKGNQTYCTGMPCIQGNSLPCLLHRCERRSWARSLVAALEFRVNRQRYLEQPDLHLAPSNYLYQLLLTTGVAPDKLKLHPNFVDTDQFFPRQTAQADQGHFLYFGRLSHEKGIPTLLDAFAPLKSLCLYIAGDGPLAAYCQERIAREDLTHIRCLGRLDEAALLPWIQSARATILPSVWGEIFGLSIIESFACGSPVIGSDVGAIPELVHHGINGLLVEAGNPSALQEAIVQMSLLPKADSEAMGQAGLTFALKHFTLDQHIETLLTMYDTLLGAPHPQAVAQRHAVAALVDSLPLYRGTI